NVMVETDCSVTVSAGGTVNVSGYLNLYGLLTNRGVVNLVGGGYVQMWNNGGTPYNGAIWNEAGALWDIQNGGSVLCAYCSGLEQFHNAAAATLRKSTSTGDATLSTILINAGTLDVQTGRLSLAAT